MITDSPMTMPDELDPGPDAARLDTAIDRAILQALRVASLTSGGALGPALAVTAIDRDTALLRLSELEDDGLIALGAGAIVTIAAELEAQLWQGVSEHARMALHRKLAAVLPEGSEDALRHLALGTEDEDSGLADRLADRAQQRMMRVGASAAAEFAAIAARLSPEGQRADRLVEAGRFALAAGTIDVAERHLTAALELAPDPVQAATITAAMGQLWIIDGQMGRAEAVLADAATSSRSLAPLVAAMLDAGRGWPLALLGRTDEALRATTDAMRAATHAMHAVDRATATRAASALADPTTAQPTRPTIDEGGRSAAQVLAVRASAAAVHAVAGRDAVLHDSVVDDLVAALPDDLDLDPVGWASAIAVGQALVFGGRPAAGAELLDRLLRIGRRVGAPTLTVLPLTILAEASLRSGRWDLAGRQLREARRNELAIRPQPWMVHVLGLPARLAAARGDVAAAGAELAEARTGPATPLPGMDVLLDTAEGMAAVAAGSYHEALSAFDRVDAVHDRGNRISPEVTRHHLDHVVAALAMGATAQATAVVQRLAAATSTVRAPCAGAVLPGLAAMVEGEPAAVADVAGRVRSMAPWTAARLHLWAAERGSGEGAASWAVAAEQGFGLLQATRWQRRAMAANHRRRAAVELTARQRQIVDAVARGRTNAAIADELGVGSQTVANHLSRIYRTVGVRNRTELARTAERWRA